MSKAEEAGALLPCPFCCGKARLRESSIGRTYSVRCIVCEAGQTTWNYSPNAIAAWNKRAPHMGGPTREATEAMLTAARDWSAKKYGKPIGNDAAIGCWQAMYDALPPQPERTGLRKEIVTALDGHTTHSRDCTLSGEYLASLVWPIIEKHLLSAAPPPPAGGWEKIESAPKDGTMIQLWVEAIDKEDSCHPTENAMVWRTIGFNNRDDDGEDVWHFAGWCWQHDHFVEGDGKPTMWMPLPSPPIPEPGAEQGER